MMQSHSGSSNIVTLSGALFLQRFFGLFFGRITGEAATSQETFRKC